MKANQWANVVRWEKRGKITPFIRHREFLWQEGHTCHVSTEEADAFARMILYDLYKKTIYEDLLAIPVVAGVKSELEKFDGA